MALATMTSKGQITIPAATRSKLRLAPGSKVDFVENEAGEIVLRPVTGDIRRLRGVVKPRGPAVTVEEMDAAIGEAVAESWRRSTS
jgi:AbrB family looped-hinge helix DNA binding protein